MFCTLNPSSSSSLEIDRLAFTLQFMEKYQTRIDTCYQLYGTGEGKMEKNEKLCNKLESVFGILIALSVRQYENGCFQRGKNGRRRLQSPVKRYAYFLIRDARAGK